jgi:hypothetical protein
VAVAGGEIITTLTSPIYLPAMTGYLIGMWVLIVGVFALHQRQAHQAKAFGLIALVAAAIGTANMAGNIWFDTFVAPWLANQIPAALEVPRNGSLVIAPCPAMSRWPSAGCSSVLHAFGPRIIPLPLALA